MAQRRTVRVGWSAWSFLPFFTEEIMSVTTKWPGINISLTGSCGKHNNTEVPRYNWQTHLPWTKRLPWSRAIPAAFHKPCSRQSPLREARPDSCGTRAYIRQLWRTWKVSWQEPTSKMPPGVTGPPSPSEAPVTLHNVKMEMGKLPSGHSEMACFPGDR